MRNGWQDWTDAELEPVARALYSEQAGRAKTPVGRARELLRDLEFYGLTIVEMPAGEERQ